MFRLGAYQERQRMRRNVGAYKSRIAAPATGVFTLPAGASLAIRIPAATAAATTIATIGGRTIKSQEFYSGEVGARVRTNGVQRLGYFPKGTSITPMTGYDVLIDTGLGRLKPLTAVP